MYSFEKNIMNKIDEERWLNITYPNIIKNEYSVSSYGRIKNNKTGKILKLYPLVTDLKTENVYLTIKLKYINSKNEEIYRSFRVNRLVAWEFCKKNRDENKVVMHINDNKFDNYYLNLKWGTRAENTRDAFEKGRINVFGENNINNKYTEKYIRSICQMMEDGLTNKEILIKIVGEKATIRKNSTEWSLISHLRSKFRFTEICMEYDYEPQFNIQKHEISILQYLLKGKENIDIMKIFGYSSIKENTALYSSILKCRKIIKICSTTREKELLKNKLKSLTE